MSSPTEELPGTTSPEAAARPSDGELRRRSLEESWLQDRRHPRILSALAMVIVLLGWLAEVDVLGLGAQSYKLLAIRAAAALTAVPLLAASFAARRPVRTDAAKTLFLGAFPTLLIAGVTVDPTHISSQGWAVVILCATLQLSVLAPLRHKLAAGMLILGVYLVHLRVVTGRLHGAYGTPREIMTVVLCLLPCLFVLPWLTYRLEQRRLQEYVARHRLEQEMKLRAERERALEVAKVAAERAEREAREQRGLAAAAAEAARRAAEQAAREGRIRSELFTNMSHDLRTPMAGILGLVELMRSTPLTEEQSHYIETIRASNQTLLSLLNDIIDFSRIDEGKLPLSPVSVPLLEAVRTPAELLRVTADRKGLTLRVELQDGLPSHVLLDPARVQQIVLNLIGNALKFTEQGSVTVRVGLRGWAEGRGHLRVEVEDTGIGFNADQEKRLFERFRQAEDSTSQRFGGSGLGLSICKGLVSMMGGRIGAESEPGKGALFWFEIPTEEARAPVEGERGAALPSMRILLAEDNPVNQMVLGLMLKKLGQTVSVASDGRQALRMLTDQRFDMAIMDMQMPVIDGDDVTRRLRALSGGASLTYIVALTASATAEQQARYLAAGVDAIYTKPIDMDGLRRMMAKEGPTAMVRAGARRAAHPG